MRVSVRIPFHTAPARRPPPPAEVEEEHSFIGRPCYSFNPRLKRDLDDTRCRHCRHYLTASCPHIEEFLEGVEDLTPE